MERSAPDTILCTLCLKRGHDSGSCPRKRRSPRSAREFSICHTCHEPGHNQRNCPKRQSVKPREKKPARCSKCGLPGHANRECQGLSFEADLGVKSDKAIAVEHGLTVGQVWRIRTKLGIGAVKRAGKQESKATRSYLCGTCRRPGHTRATCSTVPPAKMPKKTRAREKEPRKPYTCRICGQVGHNKATCGGAPKLADGAVREPKLRIPRVFDTELGVRHDADIARQYGLSRSRVNQIRTSLGIAPVTGPTEAAVRRREGRRAEAAKNEAVRDTSLTIQEAARQAGCSHELVSQARKELGVSFSRLTSAELITSFLASGPRSAQEIKAHLDAHGKNGGQAIYSFLHRYGHGVVRRVSRGVYELVKSKE